MYRFSRLRFASNITCMPWHVLKELDEMTSFDRTWVLSFSERWDFRVQATCTEQEWAEIRSYIEQIQVRCLTPASLLSNFSLAPAVLNVLIVDAEGHDGHIVEH